MGRQDNGRRWVGLFRRERPRPLHDRWKYVVVMLHKIVPGKPSPIDHPALRSYAIVAEVVVAGRKGILLTILGKASRRKSAGLGGLISLATGYGLVKKPMKKAWNRGIPSLSTKGKRWRTK